MGVWLIVGIFSLFAVIFICGVIWYVFYYKRKDDYDIPENMPRVKNFMTQYSNGYFEGILLDILPIPGINDRQIVCFRPTDTITGADDFDNKESRPDDQYVVVKNINLTHVKKGKRIQYFLLPTDINDIKDSFDDSYLARALILTIEERNADSAIRDVDKIQLERIKSSIKRSARGEITNIEIERLKEMYEKHIHSLESSIARVKKKGEGKDNEN